jgi:hypothetical protein
MISDTLKNSESANPQPASPKPAFEDLSREIEKTAERQHDERIKVVRVFNDYYRCNWWAQDESTRSFWLATGTIRKSRLLRATKTNDILLMEDVTLMKKQQP